MKLLYRNNHEVRVPLRAYAVLTIFFATLGWLGTSSIIQHNHVNLNCFICLAEAPTVKKAYAYTHPTPTPTPTHEDIVLGEKHGDIVARIWNNESGQGTNRTGKNNLQVYCESKGFINEFGFNPFNKQCFKTFKDAADRVNKWVDDCLKTNTLGECLNLYSGNSKSYWAKFLNK